VLWSAGSNGSGFGDLRVTTLHLLRHAKSSWKTPGLDDHDRPLNRRGRHAAQALGLHLQRLALVPDVVLCSTAVRARQTLDLLTPAIKPARIVLEFELYEADAAGLLAYLRKLSDAMACVLLIGHNPALHELALLLAETASSGTLPRAEDKFPTAALASLAFEGGWRALQPHSAAVVGYIEPRQLMAPEP